MAANVGLNSDLKIGKHKLHIQTGFEQESNRVVVEVFEKGQLLDKRQTLLPEDIPDESLNDQVSQIHEIVVSDIELLLVASQKIKSSKNSASIKKIGLLLLEKGFYGEAVEHLLLVSKLDPKETAVYQDIGQAFLKDGDYDEAIRYFSRALEFHADYPDLYLLKAEAFWHMGQYEDSVNALSQAIKMQPEYHKAYYAMGLYLLESSIEAPKSGELLPPIERIKQAADNLKMAADLSDTYDKRLIAAGFELLDEKEKLAQALDLFKKARATQVSPVSVSTIESEFYLKFLFAGLENDSHVLNNYINTIEHTLSNHSEYADLHHSLGIAYLIKAWHYFAKTIEEFKAAIEINPSYNKASKNQKLAENEGRGLLLLLRAILKQD